MKIVVAVVFLASCAIQMVFGNSDVPSDRIAREKKTVQNMVDGLQRYKRDFSSNLYTNLHDGKIASMKEINSIFNPKLTKIEAAAKKPTAKGKNAAPCLETARAGLGKYRETGFRDLENCRLDVPSSAVSRDGGKMDSTILAGEQVLAFYDSISRSCSTSKPQGIESCITDLLKKGAKQARAFQTITDKVITSLSSAAKTDGINCMRRSVDTFRQGASQVQLEANKCIASL